MLRAAYGDGARIDVDDLEPYLGEAGGVAPYLLTGAIDKGDAAGALEILHRLRRDELPSPPGDGGPPQATTSGSCASTTQPIGGEQEAVAARAAR